MLRLTSTDIRNWADEIGTTNMLLAELDFRLVHILGVIAKDARLAERLYLKGGTAINKLYLRDLSRLSLDIDLNNIGSKDKVLSERNEVIKLLAEAVHSQDSSYVLNVRKRRYEQTTIRASYPSLADVPEQHIKIEISHVERFPILPPVRKQLRLPGEGEVWLITYRPEELIATKIRALYDRLKGRDIYDLWSVSHKLELDETVVRKLFLYYFYRGRKVFNPKLFFSRLEKAVKDNTIADDAHGFIRPDVEFDIQKGASDVLKWLGFLDKLDEADSDFLLLARVLLRKGEIPREKRGKISEIQHPLRRLFGEDIEITEEASQIKVSDITPFVRKRKR